MRPQGSQKDVKEEKETEQKSRFCSFQVIGNTGESFKVVWVQFSRQCFLDPPPPLQETPINRCQAPRLGQACGPGPAAT